MAASRLSPFERITSSTRNRLNNCTMIRFGHQRHKHTDQTYDLVVIGGGSGGLACSKQAADFGKRVAVLDYVTPSTQGTRWGLGGTCVNVGCIPKKIMHRASLLKNDIRDAQAFGWNVPEQLKIDWTRLLSSIQSYVKSLNWGHRVQLQSKHVKFFNARGSLKDEHTVLAEEDSGKLTEIHGKKIVLAVGGRPYVPHDIPGITDYSITSDDIFWMNKPPGKTLVIGASYVALECAGFLTGFGFDTTVMVRSVPLRGFDEEMANMVVGHMASTGTRFLHGCHPEKIVKIGDHLSVTYADKDGHIHSENFDTVLTATGRQPQTGNIGLNNTGIQLDQRTKKVVGGYGGDHERSSVPHIYAIGDILHGGLELTPVAIKAGRLLAERLFNASTQLMHYDRVPTTIFTPLEYACVGLTEMDARKTYGADNIEVYHAFYTPLAFTTSSRNSEFCYIKVICLASTDDRILGFHMTGPDAGEVIQGFAAALMSGVTWQQLSDTIGIHPTCAEEIVKLHITKRSNVDPHVTGC